jgi:hypothetical protein
MMWGTVLALALQAAGGPSAAQHRAPAVVTALEACQGIENESARVRCYDAAAAEFASARRSGTIRIVDAEDIRRTRRSLFGFNVPRLPFLDGAGDGKGSDEEEQSSLEGKIMQLRALPHQKWLIRLDDGASWQTTEVTVRQADPRQGESVRIRKAAMGSYILSVEGRRGVRAMRVR